MPNATRARRDRRVTALVTPDVAQALDARAAREERSLSSLVDRLLRQALETSGAAPTGGSTKTRVAPRDHEPA